METFDYIVVGAGSAGCPIARSLSDDRNNSVLVLEAGPTADRFWVHTPAGMAKLFFHEQMNWNFYTDPMPELNDRRMYWPRGKALGGSSAINGMIFIRGHKKDFDNWQALGNPGWGYEDVLPYFKRMEHNEPGADAYRGTGGPLWVSEPVVKHPSSIDFIEAAHKHGLPRTEDLNGPLHDGVGFMQYSIKHGRRHSAFEAFLRPVLSRPNLTVRTNSLVSRVVFEGNRAIGVEILDGDTRRVIKAAREVIVSAGSVNSPKLLLLSGVGPTSELERHGIATNVESPGVGSNLQDHFYVHTAYRATPGSSYNGHLRGLRKYIEGARYLLTRRGYLALGSSQVAAFVKSRPEEDYANLQISFRPMTFTYHQNGTTEVDPHPALGVSVYLLRPKTTGRVTLSSTDPAAPPNLVPNFLTDADDIDAMISGVRQIRAIMSIDPIASRTREELVPGPAIDTADQILAHMRAHGNSSHHQVGTCRMGPDPMAVVDHRLRVRGAERLRVADASIMPHLTAGNTNAPAIMIGVKAGDMILEDMAERQVS